MIKKLFFLALLTVMLNNVHAIVNCNEQSEQTYKTIEQDVYCGLYLINDNNNPGRVKITLIRDNLYSIKCYNVNTKVIEWVGTATIKNNKYIGFFYYVDDFQYHGLHYGRINEDGDMIITGTFTDENDGSFKIVWHKIK